MIGADGLEVAVLQSEEAKDFKEDLILRWGSFMRVIRSWSRSVRRM